MFEITEYSLSHQIDNFQECLWDRCLLDIAVCNLGGTIVGLLTCHVFDVTVGVGNRMLLYMPSDICTSLFHGEDSADDDSDGYSSLLRASRCPDEVVHSD
jgi:hypothetical protein